MHRIFSNDDVSREWMFIPDAQCTFPPFFTMVPGWTLGFGLQQPPFNPVAMEFEVPKDFNNKRNIEVDLHLFARRTILEQQILSKEFARLVLFGFFAGECEALQPKLCAQKVVKVCSLEQTSELNECRHFKVTFCLDPKKINPCNLGQLLILRAPLNLEPTVHEKEMVEFNGELILTAVSIRYRKNEGSQRECCPSKKCELLLEMPRPEPVIN